MFIIGVFGTHVARAQVRPVAAVEPTTSIAAVMPSAASAVVEAEIPGSPDQVRLLVGRSTLLNLGTPIARVSLTSADVADALVTSSNQLLVHGKVPGAISMFVWDRSGSVKRYEIAVERDLARMGEQVTELFPGEHIQVHSSGRSVVLSGQVSSKEVADKAVSVAAGYVDKKEDVVTLLQVRPGARSNQVLLRVRFAEVSRSALTQFGTSFFTSPAGIKNNVGRLTTQQYSAPNFSDLAWSKVDTSFGAEVAKAEGKFAFSDFLNVFLLNQKYDIGMVIKALQSRGLFESLAEPNLVAESGKEASFLAGGEFPIPVAQGSAANMAVSVQFKEFGVRLNFTPTVEDGIVHLKVRPEVSTLDYANAVVLNGFRIPALSTRRTETELTLQDGQTFAIAGLLSNQMQSTLQKIPGIGDIPILGHLFRSRAAQKDQTELVVMITPEILPNDSPGVTSSLPQYQEPFMPPVSGKRLPPEPEPAFAPAPRPQAGTPETTPIVEARNEGQAIADARAQAVEQKRLEKLAAEQAEQAERDAKAAEKALKEEASRAEAVRRQEENARKHEEKLLREQAKRDADAAEEQARRDARAAEEQAKREARAAEEQAKRDAKAAREQAKREAEAAKEQARLDAQAAQE